jgi:hypothetical protein
MLPEEIKPAMLGAIPSTMVTCSLAGVPNVTAISQVWYVDRPMSHCHFSFQQDPSQRTESVRRGHRS